MIVNLGGSVLKTPDVLNDFLNSVPCTPYGQFMPIPLSTGECSTGCK
jgi:hypothetical protein